MNNGKDAIFICLKDQPELLDKASHWFHSKWGVPVSGIPHKYERKPHAEIKNSPVVSCFKHETGNCCRGGHNCKRFS